MKTVFPTFSQEGLTKLEFFAALAMQGLLAYDSDRKNENIVKDAIDMAKTLIEELNKEDDDTRITE